MSEIRYATSIQSILVDTSAQSTIRMDIPQGASSDTPAPTQGIEVRVDNDVTAVTDEWDAAPCVGVEVDNLGDCIGGDRHLFEARASASGQRVTDSLGRFSEQPVVRGAVNDLEHAHVVGWIESPDKKWPVNLSLHVDSVVAANYSFNASSAGRHGFRLPVPVHWLDGLPHVLTVKITETGQVIGHLVEALPSIATPWPSMQRYGGQHLPAPQAPAAARRYENIVRWLTESSSFGEQQRNFVLTQLAQTHQTLVRGPDAIREFVPIAFPVVDNPVASVIVPVHNHAAVTYSCLAALSFAYNRSPFEVIVVDDGSTDETTTLPNVITGVTFLRNETTQGFVRACNLGARQARGAYIVFLNNDTEPASLWLDELRFPFDSFSDVGLTGARLLYYDGRLQDAGGIVWNNGNPWNYGRNRNPEDPRFNYTRQADYLSGAAIMISGEAWEAVGGFSEEFCPAYFEDTDLAFKVRAIGKRVVYAPHSVVYHYDGLSSSVGTEQSTKRFQEINRPTFKRRWVFAYRSNGSEGRDIDLVKDRNVHLRALVIDHHIPQPDKDAGSYAALQEIRLLQALGCKVTFLPLNFAHLGAYTETLQRLGVECVHAPYFTSVRELLSQRGGEFDVVYVTRYTAARRVLRDIRALVPQAKILFCNADLHFLREARVALAGNDPQAVARAKRIRTEELNIMQQVDVVLSYNEVEHAVILSHNLDKSKVMLAPWVVDVQEEVPSFEERWDIAFLGGFSHPPNLPAVKFFISEVMPLLDKQLPGVKFRVFGSNVPDELNVLQGENILIEGYVEDLAEVYDRCRIFVAPLLTGAGLKGKVVDALARGTPSVLSPIAAEGMGLRHGMEALIARTPEDWVSSIAALYRNPELWQQVSEQAQLFARSMYSFERGRELMAEAFQAAGLDVPCEPMALVARTARIAS